MPADIAVFGLGYVGAVSAACLAERGHRIIWDDQVRVSALQGANRDFVEGRIPHLSRLMAGSADAVVNHGDLLVLGTREPEALAAIRRSGAEGTDKTIIDLVRPPDVDDIAASPGYVGVSW